MPSGVRADARSDARVVFATAGVLSMALFLGFDGVAHSAGRPPWFLATTLAAWISVAVLSIRGAARWGGSFAPGSGMQLATIGVGTPALLASISLALARLSPLPAPVSSAGALPCLALTFAAALYPLAGAFVLRRVVRPDASHGGRRGARRGVGRRIGRDGRLLVPRDGRRRTSCPRTCYPSRSSSSRVPSPVIESSRCAALRLLRNVLIHATYPCWGTV